jgi:glycosyltransferase involved in cell wall biosynthesis
MQPASEPIPEGVRLHRLPCPAPAGYLFNALPLRRMLARIAPDILHAHYASGYGLLGRLAGFHPYVLSVWGSDVYHFPDQALWKRKLVAKNLRAADWVCSTSHAMAARTREIASGIAQLSVIPFGVDTQFFVPPRESSPSQEITIGTVKTLRPVYGIDLLIRGFAACRERLARTDPPTAQRLRLRIVGGGWQRGALEKLARQLGIEQATAFIGPVPHSEAPAELRKLDIYVAASRAESFGVAVVEASACGLPVVVTRVGGLPEVVEDARTGLIVPPEDPSAIARALLQLIEQPALARRFGDEGRRFVAQRYEFADNVSEMIEVYRRLASPSQFSYRAA